MNTGFKIFSCFKLSADQLLKELFMDTIQPSHYQTANSSIPKHTKAFHVSLEYLKDGDDLTRKCLVFVSNMLVQHFMDDINTIFLHTFDHKI